MNLNKFAQTDGELACQANSQHQVFSSENMLTNSGLPLQDGVEKIF
jgi:hypothetical protein